MSFLHAPLALLAKFLLLALEPAAIALLDKPILEDRSLVAHLVNSLQVTVYPAYLALQVSTTPAVVVPLSTTRVSVVTMANLLMLRVQHALRAQLVHMLDGVA